MDKYLSRLNDKIIDNLFRCPNQTHALTPEIAEEYASYLTRFFENIEPEALGEFYNYLVKMDDITSKNLKYSPNNEEYYDETDWYFDVIDNDYHVDCYDIETEENGKYIQNDLAKLDFWEDVNEDLWDLGVLVDFESDVSPNGSLLEDSYYIKFLFHENCVDFIVVKLRQPIKSVKI